MLKDNNHSYNKFIWLLFGITIIISLEPFFKIGFTTADDIENYMSYLKGVVYSESWAYARQSGRFFLIFTKPVYSLPYVGDSFLFAKIVQNLSLLLSYILAAAFVKKIFHSREISLIFLLILIMATPVSANYYIPFIAYPFYFTFSFSMFLSAVLLFIKYTETSKYKYVIFSAIVFFIALLFYETYLVFLLFFCVWLLVRNLKLSKGFVNFFKSRNSYKELIPFASAGLLYLILYFGFRMLFKTEGNLYSGSSFAKSFSWANFVTVIYELTQTVFPLQIFKLSHTYINQLELSFNSESTSFVSILRNIELNTVVNIIVQLAIFIYLFLRLKNISGYKKLGFGILFSLLFAFSVHAVLATAEKYNNVEAATIKGYVTSYYSYFGVWLAVLLFVVIIYKLVSRNNYLKYTVIVLFSVSFTYVSVINSYSNRIMARGWEQSQVRFFAINEMIEKGAFKECPAGSLIYSPDMYLSDVLGYVLASQGFNWGDYINVRSGTKTNIIMSSDKMVDLHISNPEAKIYRLVKVNTSMENDVLFVLAEVDKSSIDWNKGKDMFIKATCTKAKVFYYSKSNDFVLQFKTEENATGGFALINGADLSPLSNGINQINIRDVNDSGLLADFNLDIDVPVYTESFTASNMIPKYSTAINLVDQSKVKFSQVNKIDSAINVGPENVYPVSLLNSVPLDVAYSAVSLTLHLEVDFASKESSFQIVMEIRNNANEVVYWDSQKMENMSEVYFTRLINLSEMKDKKPSQLKFYLWNPDKHTFRINKIKNISIKAL